MAEMNPNSIMIPNPTHSASTSATIVPRPGNNNNTSSSSNDSGPSPVGTHDNNTSAGFGITIFGRRFSPLTWEGAQSPSELYRRWSLSSLIRSRIDGAGSNNLPVTMDTVTPPVDTSGGTRPYVINLDLATGSALMTPEPPGMNPNQLTAACPAASSNSIERDDCSAEAEPGSSSIPVVNNDNGNSATIPTDSNEEGDLTSETSNSAGTVNPTAEDEISSWSELFREVPELRTALDEIRRKSSVQLFINIMFFKLLFDNAIRILTLLGLFLIFNQVNYMLKKEVSNQACRNWGYICVILFNLFISHLYILYFFPEMKLYYALVMMPTNADLSTFMSLMWTVGVVDYLIKMETIFLKVLIVVTPGSLLPFQNRGRYFLFIEQTSQLYRNFLPVIPWLYYITWGYTSTFTQFVGLLMSGVYVGFKMIGSVKQLLRMQTAFTKFLSTITHGTPPTAEQLEAAGTMCPICHDNFSSPIRLKCSHIFCEECVSNWLDRRQTCPICRANVTDDPRYRDGSTSIYVQLI